MRTSAHAFTKEYENSFMWMFSIPRKSHLDLFLFVVLLMYLQHWCCFRKPVLYSRRRFVKSLYNTKADNSTKRSNDKWLCSTKERGRYNLVYVDILFEIQEENWSKKLSKFRTRVNKRSGNGLISTDAAETKQKPETSKDLRSKCFMYACS